MNRRQFLTAAALPAGAALFGTVLWGRAAYARHQLTRELIAATRPILTEKAHAELQRLPAKAREEIRTWFHGPCLNSAEFVYEICSHAFAEKLAACHTDELRELCFLNAFVSKVVSETEILNRVGVIAEEIGSELDQNWATCCKQISDQWDLHLRPYRPALPNGFADRMEPLIREALHEAIQRATVAGQKPALSETVGHIGASALLLLQVRTLPGITIPLFALSALQHFFSYLMGQLNNQVGDYQRAISERLARLGNRLGSEFEGEIRAQIGCLQAWQEEALKQTAAAEAQQAVSLL
jgi:hypothetical protein